MGYTPYSPVIGHISDKDIMEKIQNFINRQNVTNRYAEVPQSSKEMQKLEEEYPTENISMWDAFKNSAIEGLTSNFSDELQGALSHLSGGNYDETVKKARAYQRAIHRAHPWLSFGGNILGSIVPLIATGGIPWIASRLGLAVFGAGKAGLLPRLVGEAIGIPGKDLGIKSVARAGALSGALSGIGSGVGWGDSVDSGINNAVVGSIAAPILAIGGSVAGKAYNAIRNTGKKVPDGFSKRNLRNIASYAHNSGIQNLSEALAKKGPETRLSDIIPGFRQHVYNIVKTNRVLHEKFDEELGKRAAGFSERMGKTLDENFIKRKGAGELEGALEEAVDKSTSILDAEQLKKAFDNIGSIKSGPLYDTALSVALKPEHQKKVNQLMEHSVFRKAYEDATQDFNNRIMTDAAYVQKHHNPTMDILHRTKMKISNQIQRDNLDGIDTADLVSLEKYLIALLDDISKNYKAAREVFASYKDLSKAVKEGYDSLSPSITINEVLGKSNVYKSKGKISSVGDRTPSFEDAYKLGTRSKIDYESANSSDKLEYYKNLFNTDSYVEKLKSLFGEDSLKRLKDAFELEQLYNKTYQGIPELTDRARPKLFQGFKEYKDIGQFPHAAFRVLKNAHMMTMSQKRLAVQRELDKKIIELDSLKVGKYNSKKVANIIQDFIEAHKAGLITQDRAKRFSTALSRLIWEMGTAGIRNSEAFNS
ncbi:hypothetical protein [Bartonella sp. ML70XJBT]|uniref:hypothetical protein n=1 Tax=Bartonella sp. ML70XJBT TaxID=3019096 RepID=UPI00235F7B09|nr:hypothetical protein [Bartonella sp. ML70XJBT]